MSEIRVATRYAKSLIELAQEKGSLEAVYQDAKLLKETCEQNRNLRNLLGNPIVLQEKKLAVLKGIFGKQVSPMMNTFFEIVCRKGREGVLYGMAVEFVEQYNKIKNIQKATITTPFAIDSDTRKQFIKVVFDLTGSEVELTEKVDAELIGGYILQVGDRQFDSSIRSRLARMRVSLVDKAYKKTL